MVPRKMGLTVLTMSLIGLSFSHFSSLMSLIVSLLNNPNEGKLNATRVINYNPFNYKHITDTGGTILIFVGAFLGCWVFAILADFIGRRITLIVLGVFALGSNISVRIIDTERLGYLFMLSFSGGGAIPLIISYGTEISSPNIRGDILAVIGAAFNLAVLLEYWAQNWVKVLILIVSVISFIMSFVVPIESPYFYLMKEKRKKAVEALCNLLNTTEGIELQIKIMEKDIKTSGNLRTIVTSKSFFKSFGFGNFLFLFHLFAIGNALFIVTVWKKESKHLPDVDNNVMIYVILLSSIAPPFFIDLLKRKTLLLYTTIGMSVSETILVCIYIFLDIAEYDVRSGFHLVPNLIFSLYLVSYNLGIGVLSWVIMGEIFTTKIRSMAIAAIVSINYCILCWLHEIISLLIEYTHIWGFFLIEIVWMASIYIILYQLIETKGKTLEEIQMILRIIEVPEDNTESDQRSQSEVAVGT